MNAYTESRENKRPPNAGRIGTLTALVLIVHSAGGSPRATSVSPLLKLPLLSVFQTAYSFLPGTLQATSYRQAVCTAPTGVQPAGNWPAVTTLPLRALRSPAEASARWP